jgi:hypothetical protein
MNTNQQEATDKSPLTSSEPKKLTREQLRRKERIEKEAMQQLNLFVSRFYEFFMENDPESPEIQAKKKELSAKWKMYVHHKGLSTKALGLCEGNCDSIIEKYNEQLKEA